MLRACGVTLVAFIGLVSQICSKAAAKASDDGSDFAVVGYVPEYRYDTLDWKVAVLRTTHLVLFSLEPTAEGGLLGVNRLQHILEKTSPLSAALQYAQERGAPRPRIMISIGGGAGRSKQFPEVVHNAKNRKLLVASIVRLLSEYPQLSGVDLNWESPSLLQHWRDLGRLAQEYRNRTRAQLQGSRLLSMAYHPRVGAVANFSGLRGKASEKTFVDLFDFCHAMAYTTFDGQRSHSTPAMDQAAVDEWTRAGLPLHRLSLGVPFFGVTRKTGETVAYQDIVEKEAWLRSRYDVDETKGIYFVNGASLAKKVRFASHQGLAGVMLWELGQDARPLRGDASSSSLLLRAVWDAVQKANGKRGTVAFFLESALERLKESEDWFFSVAAGCMGVWFMTRVLLFKRTRYHVPPATSRGPGGASPDDAALNQGTE